MSDSIRPHQISDTSSIPPPSDEEAERFREALDYIVVTGSGKNAKKVMHVPVDRETDMRNETHRECDRVGNRTDNHIRKSIDVYPPGYLRWCVRCVELWRDGRFEL